MIDPERTRELFDAACELPADEQAAFLARECGNEPELLASMESLLAYQNRAEAAGFLREPVLHGLARQSAIENPAHCRTGEWFGRYRAIRLLGEGGMGEVYLAEDSELNRRVALKVIKYGAGAGRLLEHFVREGQILAQLEHENIARLLDTGMRDGVPFLVMEYVDGKPITEHCDANGLDIAERLKLFRVVCAAVQYAHRNLVVHRDLKPGNILVTAGGQVKLLDFGIAKLLDSAAASEKGTTLMPALTPEYASPEQVRGETTTTATDVYSLGVVLYELLSAGTLYRLKRRTSTEMLLAIREQEPRPASVAAGDSRVAEIEGGVDKLRRRLSGDLDQILLKAVSKEPEGRYSSVEQLADDIARHLDGLPVIARPRTLRYRAVKFVRRNRTAVIAAGVAIVSLIGGITAVAWEARVAIARGEAAQKRFEEARKLAHAVLFDYHDSIASLPGATLVRQKLVTDALTYLNAMSREAGGDTALQLELAAAYLRVGDVQGKPYTPNLGQTEAALLSYRKAVAILQPVVAVRPNDYDAHRQLANAYERIGLVQLRKFQFSDSLASHQTAMTLREQLANQRPGDAGVRRELAASHLYWGDAMQAAAFSGKSAIDDLRRALDSQRQALAIFQELSRQDPGDFELRRNMAEAYMKIGFRVRDVANFGHTESMRAEALESESNAMQLREEIAAANPGNSRDRRNLADQRMLLSDAQAANGDLASALIGYRSSIATFEALHRADPANAEARRDLTFSYFKLALASMQARDLAGALRNFETARYWVEQLLAEDPNNAEDIQHINGINLRASEAAEASGNFALAAQLYGNFQIRVKPDLSNLARLGHLNLQAAQSPRTPAAGRGKYWAAARDALRGSMALWNEAGANPSADFRKYVAQDLAIAESAK